VRGLIRRSIAEGKPVEVHGKIMRECNGISWALETMHGAGMIPPSISGDVVTALAHWRDFHYDVVHGGRPRPSREGADLAQEALAQAKKDEH